MIAILALAIAAAVAIAIWYFNRSLHYWSRLGVTQGKPLTCFLDSCFTFLQIRGFSEFVSNIYNRHPGTKYCGMYNFVNPVLLVRDPELIRLITVKDFDHFTDHVPFVDPEADPLWSNALLSLKGERWRQIRNTLSPTFTSSKIKSIYVLMLETAEDFVNHFIKQDKDIIEVEMKDAYSRFTNDVIATTAFGVKVNSLKDTTNSFYAMGKKLTSFKGLINIIKFFAHQLCPSLCRYFGITFLNKEASKYFYEVIDDTIKVREEKRIIRPDMLNLMLDARRDTSNDKDSTNGYIDNGKPKQGVKMTNQEITSQAMIFFFAGFDTVSTALSFGSYELALNKDIQDRLRKEIVLTQVNGKVTYDQLTQMKYMDMVVSEILRKWPPFPNNDRVCTKPYTLEPVNEGDKPIQIYKGQEVWVPTYGIHRDPKYYPNPDQFDPERFSEENKSNLVPYTYMPFGLGPRICIGNRFALLEIKALLFNLMLNFEIIPIKKTPIPLVLGKDFSQVPESGFWLGLKRIKQSFE